ncbi:hypothetical protein RD149_07755 [Gordonia westfalica]|uniref:Uncharacterized protein n=1 Tax=Gordonia westfalica TaxID=158898 RepID=A0ABU2GRT4_9ACTN|nr:hypothetical protein [Gordonia westfalica]MDS1113659.1 hypothetical protein [Gordonia westfalica]
MPSNSVDGQQLGCHGLFGPARALQTTAENLLIQTKTMAEAPMDVAGWKGDAKNACVERSSKSVNNLKTFNDLKSLMDILEHRTVDGKELCGSKSLQIGSDVDRALIARAGEVAAGNEEVCSPKSLEDSLATGTTILWTNTKEKWRGTIVPPLMEVDGESYFSSNCGFPISGIVLASCVPDVDRKDSQGSDSALDEGLPPGFDVTFRWVSNGEFDPLTGEGTFVRAFVESFYTAREANSISWAFPGFLEAAPDGFSSMVLRPNYGTGGRELVGTSTFSVLSRDERDSRIRFVLCEFGYASTPTGASSTGIWETYAKNSLVSIIEFDRTGQAPPPRQRGSGRRAQNNVFGGWRVLDFEFVATGSEYHLEMAGCNSLPRPEGVPQESDVRGSGAIPRAPEQQDPGWPKSGAE